MSMVAALPSTGASPMITLASAARMLRLVAAQGLRLGLG